MDGHEITLEDALYAAAQQWARDNGVLADTYSLDSARGQSNAFRWKLFPGGRLKTEFLCHKPL